jgi:hypothetical protein
MKTLLELEARLRSQQFIVSQMWFCGSAHTDEMYLKVSDGINFT